MDMGAALETGRVSDIETAMAIHDFTSERLFVDAPLSAGSQLTATPEQANYLKNVLRLGDGSSILVFNGRDGEWRARLVVAGKRSLLIEAEEQVRSSRVGPTSTLCSRR